MAFAQRDEHPVKLQETCISFQYYRVIAPGDASVAILVKLSVVRRHRLGENYYLLVSLPFLFFPPATKSLEGNVFTPVCDSVHRGGSLSRGGLCPGGGSLSRGVSHCPGWRGSLSKSRGSLSRGISVRSPPYSNVLVVSILLECILVWLIIAFAWLIQDII